MHQFEYRGGVFHAEELGTPLYIYSYETPVREKHPLAGLGGFAWPVAKRSGAFPPRCTEPVCPHRRRSMK